MLTWNWGPCRHRSRKLEEIDKPDTPEETIARVFEFLAFLNGGIGGTRVILNFLKEASQNWPAHRTITLLELRCGRGDLSAAIVRWARKKKIDVRILAIDDCPAVVSLAKEYYGSYKEITFDNRLLSDPRFLEAQKFDYVISASALHSVETTEAIRLLKMANMLAKRGVVFGDWLRDIRAWLWMQIFPRFWEEPAIKHDAALAIKKGFTPFELKKMAKEAGVEYLTTKLHFGYRFSLSGERALAFSSVIIPVPGLAGA